MTYILHTAQGDFEQTRTYATATDAVAALDAPAATPTRIASIDRMGTTISEADLRHDADHETARRPLELPAIDLP